MEHDIVAKAILNGQPETRPQAKFAKVFVTEVSDGIQFQMD
jgi:hypothetical protein